MDARFIGLPRWIYPKINQRIKLVAFGVNFTHTDALHSFFNITLNKLTAIINLRNPNFHPCPKVLLSCLLSRSPSCPFISAYAFHLLQLIHFSPYQSETRFSKTPQCLPMALCVRTTYKLRVEKTHRIFLGVQADLAVGSAHGGMLDKS